MEDKENNNKNDFRDIYKDHTYKKNYDYSNLTTKELDDIVSKYIKNFENILEGKTSTEDTTYQNYQEIIEETFENYNITIDIDTELKNSLVHFLLNSSDVSTRNLGRILCFLHERDIKLYSMLYKLIEDKIVYINDELVFTNGNIDNFRAASSMYYLKDIIANDSTKPLAETFLIDLINGTNHDYEFASLVSFLKRFTNMPNQDRLDDILFFMKECYEKGNKEHTIDNLRKMVILITKGLSIKSARDSGFYDYTSEEICLDSICCTSVIAFHEFGHAIDNHFSHRDKAKKDEDLFTRARAHILSNPRAIEIITKISQLVKEKGEEIGKSFDRQMKEKYGSYKKAIHHLEESIKEIIATRNLNQLFMEYNVSDELVNEIYDDLDYGRLNIKKIARKLYDLAKENLISRALFNMHEASFLDIISSIFGGYDITLSNRHTIRLGLGHSKDYFNSDPDNSMAEIYANLNSLLIHNQIQLLSLIKELVGDEFYEFIMNDHNSDRIPDYVPDSETRKKEI